MDLNPFFQDWLTRPRVRSHPIESVWALVKKHIRDRAPRTGPALRRAARAARHVVTPTIAVSTSPMLGTATQVGIGING